MTACKDKNLGTLLHAYELDALPDEDIEMFEIHLLTCESCYEQVRSFERESSFLRSEDFVQEAIGGDTGIEVMKSSSLFNKLLHYLWPRTPFVFRPAIAYLLVLLLILPAYFGLQSIKRDDIRPVRTVDLIPERSNSGNFISISDKKDGLISFVLRGAVPGRPYRVRIESETGQVLFSNEAFTDFDEYETGRLLLPVSMMIPGDYRLVITDLQITPLSLNKEYRFSIVE